MWKQKTTTMLAYVNNKSDRTSDSYSLVASAINRVNINEPRTVRQIKTSIIHQNFHSGLSCETILQTYKSHRSDICIHGASKPPKHSTNHIELVNRLFNNACSLHSRVGKWKVKWNKNVKAKFFLFVVHLLQIILLLSTDSCIPL